MHLRQSERLEGGVAGGCKSRTGTDWRVRGGRESEVERISQTERRAEEREGGKSSCTRQKSVLDALIL